MASIIARDKTPDRSISSMGGIALMNDLDALVNFLQDLNDAGFLSGLTIVQEGTDAAITGVKKIRFNNIIVTFTAEGEVLVSPDFPTPPTDPYWRIRGYAWDITDETQILDTTFFNGGGLPGGKTVRKWREYCLGPDGGYRQGGDWIGWVQWNRMGVENDTGASQTINWWVPGVDNTLGLCYQKNTNLAGTVAISGTAVTGTGTSFTTDFAVGDYVITGTGANLQVLRIVTITDNTNIVVAYSANAVAAGATYQKGTKLHNHAKVSPGTSNTEASGNFNMANGETGTFHMFCLNEENADNQNPHLFAFITDVLEKVKWVDAGTW